MPAAQFHFAQPQFRATDSDLKKLSRQKEWTLDTPGIGLALAVDYYRFEVFGTAHDRDACCGPTAHHDVRYVKATTEDLRHNDITIDDLACGLAVDHPHFERIMDPLFDAAIARLLRAMPIKPKRSGKLASSELLISRTRYTISAEATGEWLKFPVEAMTVFEEGDQGVMDRAMNWLHNRLALTNLPPGSTQRPN